MMLAKVIGTVVCTVKFPALEGSKLLLLQPVNKDGAPRGKTMVGIDAVGAGVGETVYWCRGREAALAFDPERVSDCSIVGIVDEISVARVSDPSPRAENPTGKSSGPACTAVGPATVNTRSSKPRNGPEKRGRR
ncbi:MAG: EutN/CcmL family microcompartment protein [Terriglobales bacterium]